MAVPTYERDPHVRISWIAGGHRQKQDIHDRMDEQNGSISV
jgi:hypothetical protein